MRTLIRELRQHRPGAVIRFLHRLLPWAAIYLCLMSGVIVLDYTLGKSAVLGLTGLLIAVMLTVWAVFIGVMTIRWTLLARRIMTVVVTLCVAYWMVFLLAATPIPKSVQLGTRALLITTMIALLFALDWRGLGLRIGEIARTGSTAVKGRQDRRDVRRDIREGRIDAQTDRIDAREDAQQVRDDERNEQP